MNFIELSKARYSVRDFSDRPVEEEKLRLILEAGRLAPTAVNSQPQRIFVLKSKESIEKIRKATRMAYNAPVVLMICYDKNSSWKAARFGESHDTGEEDASIVTTAMMMQATELGIGTLWARGYNTKDITDAFGIPDNLQLVCLLDLGYPSDTCKPSDRHFSRVPLEDTVTEL